MDSYSTSTRRTQKFSVQNFVKCPPFVLDGIYYHIKKMDLPVFPRFRRMAPDHLADDKQTVARMEEMGLCQRASSQWSSLLRIVLKKDGSLPQCGDYRRLNMQTKLDHYPIPNITDVTSNLHKAKVFFMLDILKGITKDAKNWVNRCTHAKLQKYIDTDSGVGTFPQPQHRFAQIHIDARYRFNFSIVDIISKSSGNHPTSDYHLQPASNIMVEHFHRIIKASLMSHCKDSNWFTQLPWILLGLSNTPKDTLNILAAEMMNWLSLPNFFHLQPPPTTSSAYVTLQKNLLYAARHTSPHRSNTYQQNCTQQCKFSCSTTLASHH
ncbi:uncharacterized protein [Palaemon carinicauda]|uniref:uncharacterized protein n=1 Tax=Palaemon carinicauda TaxID=392227 RepID=UPI0035B5C699